LAAARRRTDRAAGARQRRLHRLACGARAGCRQWDRLRGAAALNARGALLLALPQVAYWQQHSAEPTLETMMLDTKARELDAAERPEIMGASQRCSAAAGASRAPGVCAPRRRLPRPRRRCSRGGVHCVTRRVPLCCAALLPPSLAGLRVLELGAGIGRFTGLLAAHGAAHVHAVDFMKNLIDEVRGGRLRRAAAARARATRTAASYGSRADARRVQRACAARRPAPHADRRRSLHPPARAARRTHARTRRWATARLRMRM
jgi:hypothetical protein